MPPRMPVRGDDVRQSSPRRLAAVREQVRLATLHTCVRTVLGTLGSALDALRKGWRADRSAGLVDASIVLLFRSKAGQIVLVGQYNLQSYSVMTSLDAHRGPQPMHCQGRFNSAVGGGLMLAMSRSTALIVNFTHLYAM